MNIVDSSCWIEYLMNSEIGTYVAPIIENVVELTIKQLFGPATSILKIFLVFGIFLKLTNNRCGITVKPSLYGTASFSRVHLNPAKA
jgi:hypothetical protein